MDFKFGKFVLIAMIWLITAFPIVLSTRAVMHGWLITAGFLSIALAAMGILILLWGATRATQLILKV